LRENARKVGSLSESVRKLQPVSREEGDRVRLPLRFEQALSTHKKAAARVINAIDASEIPHEVAAKLQTAVRDWAKALAGFATAGRATVEQMPGVDTSGS
jgi:hypothetical protein